MNTLWTCGNNGWCWDLIWTSRSVLTLMNSSIRDPLEEEEVRRSELLYYNRYVFSWFIYFLESEVTICICSFKQKLRKIAYTGFELRTSFNVPKKIILLIIIIIIWICICFDGVAIAAQCTATFSDLLFSPEFKY